MRNTSTHSSSSYYESLKVFLQKIILIISRSFDHHHDDVFDDPESTSAAPEAEPQPSVPAPAPAARPKPTKYQNLDWEKIIVVYCLSTAVAMALTPVQVHSNQLPLTFRFLGLTVLFSFACIMVSKFIHNNNCPRITVDLFHSFGVFFGITAFLICIAIPFPLWFKCTASVIYVVSGLVIMFCNYFL